MKNLTIAICTYNRLPQLKILLNSFYKCEKISQTEIIIVDNSSDDKTSEFFNNYLHNLPLSYHKIPPKGLSNARNYALENATSQFVVFFDDDCIIPKECVKELINFLTINQPDAFSGVVIPLLPYNRENCIAEEELASHWNGTNLTYLPGNFLGVKKLVFEEIGGFNEHFGPIRDEHGYGDDTLFEHKLNASNKQIAYIPKAIVYHFTLHFNLQNWYRDCLKHAVFNIRMQRELKPNESIVYFYVKPIRTFISLSIRALFSFTFDCKLFYSMARQIGEFNGGIRYWLKG